MYLIALLSKESAILAPLLFLLDSGGDAGRENRGRRLLPLYAVALAIGVALRWNALGSLSGPQTTIFLDNPSAFVGGLSRVLTGLWVQLLYIGKVCWPASLSSDYSHASIPVVAGFGDPRAWAGLAMAAAFVVAAVRCWRRSRCAVVALAIWVLFFLPSSNLLFPAGTLMAERLAYLPSLGVCLLAAHGLARIAATGAGLAPLVHRRRLRVGVVVATAGIVAVLFAVRTVARNPDWRDNQTLAFHDVLVRPDSAKLQFGAGLAWNATGDPEAAEAAFRTAVEIYPEYAQAHFNLAQLLMGRGSFAEAIVHLQAATRIAPGNPRPYKSLAPLLERSGDVEGALVAYAAGARLDPADLGLRYRHATLLVSAGRTAEGSAAFEALVRDARGTVEGAMAGANVAELRGEPDRAAQIYRAILGESGIPAAVRHEAGRRLQALENRPGR